MKLNDLVSYRKTKTIILDLETWLMVFEVLYVLTLLYGCKENFIKFSFS